MTRAPFRSRARRSLTVHGSTWSPASRWCPCSSRWASTGSATPPRPALRTSPPDPVCHFWACRVVLNGMDDAISTAWRANRPYLIDLAFRMLGDIGTAEDVVQEAFLRLLQQPVGDIEDERGWLIVVTSRLCIDHIRSAPSRRE